MQKQLKMVGASVLVAASLGSLPWFNVNAVSAPTQISILSPEAISYETSINQWLENLVNQESSGNARIVVLDVNGRYSYGCLQFQRATWDAYRDAYGITADDIFDCNQQRKLARLMIEDDYSNWRHWFNSVTRYGVGKPPKLSR